jgi:hypothetical protein
MLRPACLLPVARLSPAGGLLTPRSGTEVSLHYLGPATRRTDAYRDGTLTRWTGAACTSTTSPLRVQSSLCFVTHHVGILGGPSRAALSAAAQRRGPTRIIVVADDSRMTGDPQCRRHCQPSRACSALLLRPGFHRPALKTTACEAGTPPQRGCRIRPRRRRYSPRRGSCARRQCSCARLPSSWRWPSWPSWRRPSSRSWPSSPRP